jgi:hypothetical protein
MTEFRLYFCDGDEAHAAQSLGFSARIAAKYAVVKATTKCRGDTSNVLKGRWGEEKATTNGPGIAPGPL